MGAICHHRPARVKVGLCMRMPQKHHQKIITAAEVGDFVFCAKAWHLKRGGAKPQNPRLDPGIAFHEEHRDRLMRGELLRGAGVICAVIALIVFIYLILTK